MEKMKKYTTEIEIAFLKLEKYTIPLHFIAELKLYSKMPRHLGICSTVSNIIENLESGIKEEEEVCILLAHILSHHFNPE